MIVFAAVVEPTLSRQDNSVVLYDSGRLTQISENWFQESYWRTEDKVVGEASGRGSVVFVRHDDHTWVLRHYHRGGFVGRFIRDRYLWRGIEQTRAFREWRLLSELSERNLPVPEPIAARVRRFGVSYTADLITGYLSNTRSLESILDDGGRNMWMASAVEALAGERALHGVDISGSAWIEIDYQEDLEAARSNIWPLIERRRHPRNTQFDMLETANFTEFNDHG